jgi:hypothetical protein
MKFKGMFPGVKIYRVLCSIDHNLFTSYQWSECHSYCSPSAICFVSSQDFFGSLNPKISCEQNRRSLNNLAPIHEISHEPILLIRDLVNAPSSSRHLACGKPFATNEQDWYSSNYSQTN